MYSQVVIWIVSWFAWNKLYSPCRIILMSDIRTDVFFNVYSNFYDVNAVAFIFIYFGSLRSYDLIFVQEKYDWKIDVFHTIYTVC